MSDEKRRQPLALPPEARHARSVAKRSLGLRMRGAQFSARAERFIDAQVHDGLDWRAAAQSAGITIQVAKVLMCTPKFIRAMMSRAEQLRAIEGTRNPVVLAKIRDRALDDNATAAQQKASIEAARLLEDREQGNPAVNVHVGPVVQVLPGLSIDLSGPAAEPVKTSRSATDCLRSPPVTIDIDGEAAEAQPVRRERD